MVPLSTPLLGNETVRARLWRAADEGRLHHCFLFEGPEGVGKHTTALRLALYLNCLSDGARPCGQCAACRPILAGIHPDVISVAPQPDRATPVITAEQARELVGSLALRRHSARHRVVIIDPADALTEEAANAMLKTLEEPPAGTRFILITARAASLLQTVRSRSQRVRFGSIPEDTLRSWLVARGAEPELAVLAMGSPGRALALAEGAMTHHRGLVDGVLNALGQPLYRLFAFSEETMKKSDADAAQVVDVIEALLRDVVMVANHREERVLHPDRLPLLRRYAAALWPGGVGRLNQILAEARVRLDLNVNDRLVLDALMTALNLELSQMVHK